MTYIVGGKSRSISCEIMYFILIGNDGDLRLFWKWVLLHSDRRFYFSRQLVAVDGKGAFFLMEQPAQNKIMS